MKKSILPSCHPERSEGSQTRTEIPRCTRNNNKPPKETNVN